MPSPDLARADQGHDKISAQPQRAIRLQAHRRMIGVPVVGVVDLPSSQLFGSAGLKPVMNTSPHKGRLRSWASELLRSRFESPGLRRNHTSRPHRTSPPEHRKISTTPFFFSVSQRPSGEDPGCVVPNRMSAHSAEDRLTKAPITFPRRRSTRSGSIGGNTTCGTELLTRHSNGNPDRPHLADLPGFDRRAASRCGVTTPKVPMAMALPVEDPKLRREALVYVIRLYDELTEENGAPTLGTQNQAVDFILADPELCRAVEAWAQTASRR